MIVYTLPDCPNCARLKEALTERCIPFEEKPLDDPESLTDMRVNGCFTNEAPVLKIGDVYLKVIA